MKKIFILTLLLLFFTSTAFAMGTAPKAKIKTGDKALDKALMEIDKLAVKPEGVKEIMGLLVGKFSVTQKEIDSLRKRGYALTGVYYLSLLAKQSGKKVNTVAALHAKGTGWGVLAKKVGVHPGDLNRLRVRLHKITKKAVKEKKVKAPIPKAPKVKSVKPGKGKNR